MPPAGEDSAAAANELTQAKRGSGYVLPVIAYHFNTYQIHSSAVVEGQEVHTLCFVGAGILGTSGKTEVHILHVHIQYSACTTNL